jgi:hypothetical protein
LRARRRTRHHQAALASLALFRGVRPPLLLTYDSRIAIPIPEARLSSHTFTRRAQLTAAHISPTFELNTSTETQRSPGFRGSRGTRPSVWRASAISAAPKPLRGSEGVSDCAFGARRATSISEELQ